MSKFFPSCNNNNNNEIFLATHTDSSKSDQWDRVCLERGLGM
jgi:hypothetical protein